MPSSQIDFENQIASRTAPSGNVFSVSRNADGTTKISRALASSKNADGTFPGTAFAVLYPRVVYNYVFDSVDVGDGAAMATVGAVAFIAGLN